MPGIMKPFLPSYSNDEIMQYPVTVLNCIIKLAYVPKVPLIPGGEVKEVIQAACNLRTDNPARHYRVVEKIGEGGFANVYKVQRLSDGVMCALKWQQPKSKSDKDNIINEIGIMQHFNSKNDCGAVVQCLDAFDYDRRIWIFLELMDGGSLTDICEAFSGNYSENFCKYTLYKVMHAMKALHQ